jgi:hypothetical protein
VNLEADPIGRFVALAYSGSEEELRSSPRAAGAAEAN